MPHAMSPGKPITRRYSEAQKDRAVRMVFQLRKELGPSTAR
jgi:transposase